MNKILPQLEASIDKVIKNIGVKAPKVKLPTKTKFPSRVGGAVLKIGGGVLSAVLMVADAPAANAPGMVDDTIWVKLPEDIVNALEDDGVKPIVVESPDQQAIQDVEDEAIESNSCTVEIKAEAKLDNP